MSNIILKTSILVIVLIFISLITFNLGINTPFWNDELLAIDLSRKNIFKEFFISIYSDAHPPLYHLILKLSFSIFAESFFSARFPSYLFSVLTLIILFLKLKRGLIFKLIFVSIFLTNWSAIYYSQEVRPYTLLLFLSCLLYLNFIERIFEKKNNFFEFCILSVLSIFTHHIIIFFIIGMYMSEIIYNKKINFAQNKKYFFGFFVLIILFLIQIFIFSALSDRPKNWSEEFTLNYLHNFFINFKMFYYNNLLLFYHCFKLLNYDYFFFLITSITFLLILIANHYYKNFFSRLYFNYLIFFVPLSIVSILNVPMINHYVYIFLLIPFTYFVAEFLYLIVDRGPLKKYFIFSILFIYITILTTWNLSKMSDKWFGSTHFNGDNNLLSLRNICNEYDCYLINDYNKFFSYNLRNKIITLLDIKLIEINQISSVFDFRSQFVLTTLDTDIYKKLIKTHKCFVLSKNTFKNLVVFLNNDLSPEYLEHGIYEDVPMSIINKNYFLSKNCVNP